MPEETNLIDEFRKGYEKQFSEHSAFLPFAKTEVYFRPIKTREQKAILKSLESGKSHLIGRTLDEVTTAFVTNFGDIKSIDEMYIEDRNYLYLLARARSKDPIVSFKPTCPECGNREQEVVEINIDELEVKELDDSCKDYVVDLLDGEYQLILNPPRRAREKEKDSYKKSQKETDKGIVREGFFVYALVISKLVKKATGEEQLLSFKDAVDLVDNMLERDRDQLSDYIEKVRKYGFKNTVEFSCADEGGCGFTGEVIIDLTDFFMR